jgi:bifunctional DNA primase/polymerase-like protein
VSPLEVRQALIDHGYTPIPVTGKKPPFNKWQKVEKVSRSMLEAWDKNWPGATNTGILTEYTPTLDADILSEPAAVAIEKLVYERFKDRGPILSRIGRPPKRAIVFRTATPFAKITVNLIAANGSTGEKIEFMGNGQQVVAAGIHPDTGKPYIWPLGNLTDVARDALPEISEAEAKQLVDDIVELLCRDFGYKRAAARAHKGGGAGAGDPAKDWQALVDGILAGTDLHANTRDLAAKMARAGMDGGAIVNLLRGLMDSSAAPRDQRWQDRYDNLPRQVDSIQAKIAAEQAAAAAVATAAATAAVVPVPGSGGAGPPPPPPIPPGPGPTSSAAPGPQPQPQLQPLDAVHAIFKKWLGTDYDTGMLDAVLAAGAAARLTGDPLWLLVISGSGNAKTETVQTLEGAGACVTSTITSEGALLSASSRSAGATGGLLLKLQLGNRGLLVIKDVTSIIQMDSRARAHVLAALREIHDGKWERNVGVHGGKTLTWVGRITIVGACTTVWDTAHDVIAVMGDRFVIVRTDTEAGREEAALMAIGNAGQEAAMRAELAAAVGGLVAGASLALHQLTRTETRQLIRLANIVTRTRSGVQRDYKGDIIDAHALEMPTRFAKQLTALVRGAVAIGMAPEAAMRLAARCARDSISPLRLAILFDVADHPDARPREVADRIVRPRMTALRELEALRGLKALVCDVEEVMQGGREVTLTYYNLAPALDRDLLLSMR